MTRSKVRRRGIVGRLGPVAASIVLLAAALPAASIAGAEQGTPLPRSGQLRLASDVPREKIAVAGNLTSSDFTSTDRVILRWSDATPSGGASDVGAQPTRVARVTAAAGEQATWLRALAVGGDVYRFDSRLSPERVAATVGALRGQPGVASIEPDQILQAVASPPNDPYWTTPAPGQWDLSEGTTPTSYGIDLLGAWDTTLGSGVVVAVIDTGITTHPDLAGQTVAGYDFIGDTLVANDGDGRDADPSDPGDWITPAENAAGYFVGCGVRDSSWHGTHVSGTIAALTNNATGIAGIAPSAKVQPVRVLGKCGGYLSDISDAIVWASGGTVAGVPANANPARVINMSLGGSGTCDTTFQAAIDGAGSRGTVVAVSAGNNGADASGFAPANCAGVVTVAATNRIGTRPSFSNYGSTVEMAAPGVELWSTLNAGSTDPTTPTYAQYSGTSMAAPHVAGVAALMLAANTALTPAQVVALMQATAHPLAAGGCPPGCGSIVDAKSGVTAAVLPTVSSVTPANGPAGGGTTVTIEGTGFTGATAVDFGPTAAASYTVSSDTEISADSPAGTGTVHVTVTRPPGTSATSSADQFTYLDAPISYPAVIRDGVWYLRESNTSTPGTITAFAYGAPTDTPVFGDWDGDGIKTAGLVRATGGSLTWYLRNTNSSGAPDLTFSWGAASDRPLVGDWNGDGIDSIGILRGNWWILRNTNSAGPADLDFFWGLAADTPLVGDWDGNGTDTPGWLRCLGGSCTPGTGNWWILRNSNSDGPADTDFFWGRTIENNWAVGDWDGNGTDNPGILRGSWWLLRAANSDGPPTSDFFFGLDTDTFRVWAQ